MKTLVLILISFYCPSGKLTNTETNKAYKLVCKDYDFCYFTLSVPEGPYTYVSDDKKDTCIFFVQNKCQDIKLLKKTGDFTLIN